MELKFSVKVGSDPEQVHTRVIHGWMVDSQNTSYKGTRNDLTRHVVVHVQMCSKESKAAMEN